MSEREASVLWERLSEAGSLSNRWLHGAEASVNLAELSRGSSLAAPLDELRGASVLVLTKHQLPSALALIELDGVARRVVVCPLDLQPEHLPSIMEAAKIDTVVGDRCLGVGRFVPCSTQITPAHRVRRCCQRTEWVLMTSGTTGVPKLVAHTLCSLSTAMAGRDPLGAGAVWSTFYDMRRYGGLQIFLRAMLGGGSMVLSSAEEPVGGFPRPGWRHGVTHISGTPSHWRRALMSPARDRMAPRYVRMSGEIADQAILDHLRAAFPDADIAHAFASTEAGVAFDVGDGLAGFPAEYLGRPGGDVDMRVVDGSLRIRSARNALGYLGDDARPLFDADGFVDTGDMVEPHDGRYFFVGRRGGDHQYRRSKGSSRGSRGGDQQPPGRAHVARQGAAQPDHRRHRRRRCGGQVALAKRAETEALKGEILERAARRWRGTKCRRRSGSCRRSRSARRASWRAHA